jgi:cysteine/O-acetylserine efflux protein
VTNLLPFLTYMLVTTFTPGPNNILSMSNGVRYGYKKTLPFLLGIFTGFALVLLLCGLLNIFLVGLLPQIEPVLKIAGTLYMLYLAVYLLRSKPANDEQENRGSNTFRAGFILQFLNLKGILYSITIYSTFIVPSYHHPLQISLFALLLAGVGFVSISSWAIGGNLFRNFLQRYDRAFHIVMAALLVYTALASLF